MYNMSILELYTCFTALYTTIFCTVVKVMWDVIGVSVSRKCDTTMYIYCVKVMWDVIGVSASRKCDTTMYIY